jgi:allantoin racemase
MPTIHLIIPTTTKFDMLPAVAHFSDLGITFTQSHIDMGPPSIESEYDELFCGPNVVMNAIQAQNDGADAVMILCMGDPALGPTREAVTIPVIGIGETAMHFAAMLGHKFSVLPTLERRRSTYEHHARSYGLESRLASVRPTNVSVLEIHGQTNLKEILMERALSAIIEDHADVIILGCAGFQDLDRQMEEELAAKGFNVPVIDAVPLAVMTALTLIRTRLRHSKKAYPFPPEKVFQGYNIPKLAKL